MKKKKNIQEWYHNIYRV